MNCTHLIISLLYFMITIFGYEITNDMLNPDKDNICHNFVETNVNIQYYLLYNKATR